MTNILDCGESSKPFETEAHHLRAPFLAATIEYLAPFFVMEFCTPIGIIHQKFRQVGSTTMELQLLPIARVACVACAMQSPKTGYLAQNRTTTCSKRPNTGTWWLHLTCNLTSLVQRALHGPLTP